MDHPTAYQHVVQSAKIDSDGSAPQGGGSGYSILAEWHENPAGYVEITSESFTTSTTQWERDFSVQDYYPDNSLWALGHYKATLMVDESVIQSREFSLVAGNQ